MNHNIDAFITVKFRVNDLIDIDTLNKYYDGDVTAAAKRMLLDERISDFASDDGEFVSAEIIEDK